MLELKTATLVANILKIELSLFGIQANRAHPKQDYLLFYRFLFVYIIKREHYTAA